MAKSAESRENLLGRVTTDPAINEKQVNPMAASLVTRRLLFAVLLRLRQKARSTRGGSAANNANRPFERKSVATNCRAAKFKAVKANKATSKSRPLQKRD